MNLGTILVGVIARIGTALFTEKVVINLVVILASWLASKTENDLDDQLVEALKDALDKDHGQPRNLYDDIRKKD